MRPLECGRLPCGLLTHMGVIRTQYLVFPSESKGSCLVTAIFLTACQRPLFLHPGLYF